MIKSIRGKVTNPEMTISGQMMEKLHELNYDYIHLGKTIGQDNKDYYSGISTQQNENWFLLQNTASNSIRLQDKIEKKSLESGTSFEDYKADYFED